MESGSYRITDDQFVGEMSDVYNIDELEQREEAGLFASAALTDVLWLEYLIVTALAFVFAVGVFVLSRRIRVRARARDPEQW